jgi:hypothetical protein
MSFPGTYNINYYYGDTYEFRVYPKNSNGSAFNLDNFDTVKFIVAPTRGAVLADQVSCYAAVSSDGTNVLCAIRPSDALKLDSTLQYVYDVEISRSSGDPYDIVYTLLTGNLTITRDVTIPESITSDPIPNNPTNLVVGTITDTTIQVSWTAPIEGGVQTGYKVAIIPYTTNQETLEDAIENSTVTITADQTNYTFFGLTENTQYSVLILAKNDTGDALYSSVLTNDSPISTADNPNTLDPDFIVTNDGNSAFLIDGVANDSITVIRGETYNFSISATGHPFWIQTTPAPYNASSVYSLGISNNGTEMGILSWTVDQLAPNTLFYVCENHSVMSGTISVIDGGS